MASSKNDKYAAAQQQYNNAVAQNTGVTGYQNAVKVSKDTALENNRLSNEQAKKYAGQQAQAQAAGAQSQATTAARAAGMNKAQAAMMGAQQNAAAYQNAYGNAYAQQYQGANSNLNNQQQMAINSNTAAVQGAGTNLSAQQQEGQNEYDRTWGNWGNALGIGGSLIKPFSDENLKHYKECSQKVVYKTPSKIKALKFEKKE